MAIGAASAGDFVWVAGGVYRPGTLKTDVYIVQKKIWIEGGYAGAANPSDPDERDIDAYPTILEGELASGTDHFYHLMTFENTGSSPNEELDTRLSGFIIQNGLITSGNPGPYPFIGAGVRVLATSNSCSVEFRDCIFRNNVSGACGGGTLCGGGAMAIERDQQYVNTVILRDCRFENNSSIVGGAILANGDVRLSAYNCTFEGNEASSSTSGNLGGGAIWAVGELGGPNPGPPVLKFFDCLFKCNLAANQGGAIGLALGELHCTDTIFVNNGAGQSGSVGFGGAIYIDSSSAGSFIDRCAFIANRAVKGGAFATNDASPPGVISGLISNSLFNGNWAFGAQSEGGAIRIGSSAFDIVNCTVVHNRVRATGSVDQGGGIWSIANIDNTIVWHNTRDNGGVIEVDDVFFQTGVSVFPARLGYCNTEQIDSLYPAGAKVGTITSQPIYLDRLGTDGTAGTIDDNLRLKSSAAAYSPDIDAASDAAITGFHFDLDLLTRIIDDPNAPDTGLDDGADLPNFVKIVDMGAYEADCPDWCPPDLNHDFVVDINDLNLVLGNFSTSPGACGPGDADGSGTVDITDLNIVLGNLDTDCGDRLSMLTNLCFPEPPYSETGQGPEGASAPAPEPTMFDTEVVPAYLASMGFESLSDYYEYVDSLGEIDRIAHGALLVATYQSVGQ